MGFEGMFLSVKQKTLNDGLDFSIREGPERATYEHVIQNISIRFHSVFRNKSALQPVNLAPRILIWSARPFRCRKQIIFLPWQDA